MGKKEENRDFVCIVCGKQVTRIRFGSYRNHCPVCLSSVHVDENPGDRKSTCHGMMRAVAMRFHSKKGWQIVHRCTKCHVEKLNKIVENDIQSDDWSKIIEISKRR